MGRNSCPPAARPAHPSIHSPPLLPQQPNKPLYTPITHSFPNSQRRGWQFTQNGRVVGCRERRPLSLLRRSSVRRPVPDPTNLSRRSWVSLAMAGYEK